MATSSAARDRHSVGLNLATILALVAVGAVALAYAIDAAGRNATSRGTDADAPLTRTIGGKDLEIPVAWFRYSEQRVEGFAKQIDLQLMLPLGAEATAVPIEVTLMPSSRVRPSSRLLDGVYLHQFQATERDDGPVGLVGKPLKGAEGYSGETVWYDPLSADPFVAKCAAPVAEGTSPRCLRAVHLGPGLAAVYVFSEDVLVNWKRFDPEMRAALARIGI